MGGDLELVCRGAQHLPAKLLIEEPEENQDNQSNQERAISLQDLFHTRPSMTCPMTKATRKEKTKARAL